jgi:hypothetical protein
LFSSPEDAAAARPGQPGRLHTNRHALVLGQLLIRARGERAVEEPVHLPLQVVATEEGHREERHTVTVAIGDPLGTPERIPQPVARALRHAAIGAGLDDQHPARVRHASEAGRIDCSQLPSQLAPETLDRPAELREDALAGIPDLEVAGRQNLIRVSAAHDQDARRQARLVRDRDAGDDRADAEADQRDPPRIDLGPAFGPIDQAADVGHGGDEPVDHLIDPGEEHRLAGHLADRLPVENWPIGHNLQDVDRSAAALAQIPGNGLRGVVMEPPDRQDDDQRPAPRPLALVVPGGDQIARLTVLADRRHG